MASAQRTEPAPARTRRRRGLWRRVGGPSGKRPMAPAALTWDWQAHGAASDRAAQAAKRAPHSDARLATCLLTCQGQGCETVNWGGNT